MRHIARAAAILGLGMFLLAAGNAPDADLDFGTVPAAEVQAPAIIEEPYVLAEPELSPVLPEAATLSAMVRDVKAMPAISLDRQAECLATAVYYESKSESLEGQLAVAQVILNRVEKGRFGADICGVVKAPGQFSFVRGGRIPPPVNMGQYATARAIAVIAMSDGWSEMVGSATHFHATRVSPGWRMQRVATIGNHVFYR